MKGTSLYLQKVQPPLGWVSHRALPGDLQCLPFPSDEPFWPSQHAVLNWPQNRSQSSSNPPHVASPHFNSMGDLYTSEAQGMHPEHPEGGVVFVCLVLVLFRTLYLVRAVLGSHQCSESLEISHTPHPHTRTASHDCHWPPQSGTFVTTEESTLTHHYQPEFIVYGLLVVVYFCEFREIYTDIYLPLEYHNRVFSLP